MGFDDDNYCYYSDLPSPKYYMADEELVNKNTLSAEDIDRIIEMGWEDRTSFDAIKYQFGLSESQVRKMMKAQLNFRSYKLWRKRVEACNTKHQKKRSTEINRFRCTRQRAITQNKISKRK